MELFLRGEEICHPPQFPVPEVRLPIGAVGRMGTGSSTDLTVAGSPRLPSFSERTYGEQLRCRRGCFLFWGRDDLGIPWGASVGVRMVRVRYRYCAERESGPLPDGIVRRTGWRAVSREMWGSFGGDEGQCVLGLVRCTHGNTYPCCHFGADVLPET